jgi:hypothetical protein
MTKNEIFNSEKYLNFYPETQKINPKFPAPLLVKLSKF